MKSGKIDWRKNWLAAGTVVAVALGLCNTAAGQATEIESRFKSAYKLGPAAGGWYQPDSNLGNINFDVSDTGVVAGNWSTFRDGKPIWYYFQGEIQYSSDEVEKQTGVIAVAESPLVEVLTGGACPSCTYIPPIFAEPAHRMRLEFTSSRSARFIYDDTTPIPILAWMQGAPLFAPRDYSGEWLAIARHDSYSAVLPRHVDLIAHIRLEALTGAESYSSTALNPEQLAAISPPTGARRYKLSCVGPSKSCDSLMTDDNIFDVNATNFPLLWIGDDESGRVLLATANATEGYSLSSNFASPGTAFRIYGERDSVKARRSVSPTESATYGITEIVLKRLPNGFFDGREWGDLSSSIPF